jgi:multidrug resistance efflux pump
MQSRQAIFNVPGAVLLALGLMAGVHALRALLPVDAEQELTLALAAHGGQVLEVLREEGEFAAAGAPLVILADVGHPYVDVFIPQGHPAPPQVGDPISIRVDALDESLAGVVEYIGRRTEFTPKFLFSDRERPNLVIRMRVRITDPDHRLRAGMPAFATFDEAGA